jgi:NTP pyrophosphatase (non-canonical NTP hydrolase)
MGVNRQEMLLTIAMEECNEVAQRISKALRFGLEEIQPGQPSTNATRILQELADVVAALEMAGVSAHTLTTEAIAAKMEKIEKYLAYSQTCGTLEP